MESCFQNTARIIQTNCHVFRTMQLAGDMPTVRIGAENTYNGHREACVL